MTVHTLTPGLKPGQGINALIDKFGVRHHKYTDQERTYIAWLQRDTGLDVRSTVLLYHHRHGFGFGSLSGGYLSADEKLYCEALEQRLATTKAERALGGVGSSNAKPAATALTKEEPPSPLPRVNMATWDTEPVPEQDWAVVNRIPRRQCILFSGEGAAGKSTVQLHLSAAHVLGRDWLGTMPEMGPAIFVDAEDDAGVMHRRLAAITRHFNVTFNDLRKGGLLGKLLRRQRDRPRPGAAIHQPADAARHPSQWLGRADQPSKPHRRPERQRALGLNAMA
jgi:hypothetical protein